jgi:hypothetical protein
MRYQNGNEEVPPATGSLTFAADFLGEGVVQTMVRMNTS